MKKLTSPSSAIPFLASPFLPLALLFLIAAGCNHFQQEAVERVKLLPDPPSPFSENFQDGVNKSRQRTLSKFSEKENSSPPTPVRDSKNIAKLNFEETQDSARMEKMSFGNPDMGNKENPKLDAQKRFARMKNAVGLQTETITLLNKLGVKTNESLRQKLALRNTNELNELSDNEIVKLKKATVLSLLSNDPRIYTNLAEKKLTSFPDLQKLKGKDLLQASDFEKVSGEKLSKQEVKTAQEIVEKEFQKKVSALVNISNQLSVNWLAQLKNPSPLYPNPKLPQKITNYLLNSQGGKKFIKPTFPSFEGGEEGSGAGGFLSGCLTCDESSSWLSPSAYLANLLQFVISSFPSDLGTLDLLNQRFQQRMEDPISSHPMNEENEASYVKFSNQVLENLIAELDSQMWPHDSSAEIETSLERRHLIFEQMKKCSIPSPECVRPYTDEPDFNEKVLINLFDAYVSEFGVTRPGVQSVLDQPAEFKEWFAREHGMVHPMAEPILSEEEDLQSDFSYLLAIGRDDQDINWLEISQITNETSSVV